MPITHTKLTVAALAMSLLLPAAGAEAAVIYDGGAPNQATAYYADTNYGFTIGAESFSLGVGSNTIGGINWWGVCDIGACPAGNFTIAFYSDGGGLPGTLLNAFSVGNANQTSTGLLVNSSLPEYSYAATVPDLVLTAGTTYWLGISNTTPLGSWAWETTQIGGHSQFLTGTGWTAQPDDLAFNLTSPSAAVPEPLTLSLFVAGFAGAALRRRKRNA